MPRWTALLGLVIGGTACADSIAVQITPARHAQVEEHYSAAGASGLVFLASPCATVENLHLADGQPLQQHGAGPWITVPVPGSTQIDLSYDVVPTSDSLRACGVPVVMPRHAVGSVSIMIRDGGSGLSRVAAPRFETHPESKTWTATLPAVPSHLQLEWETGGDPPPSPAGPTGLFEWNFWGLVSILVTWTIAYLFWAQRQAS